MEGDPRPGLSGIQPEDLETWLVAHGERSYRARQVSDGLWRGHARTAAAIPTLPAALRDALDAAFRFDTIETTELVLGDGGQTEKALHRLADGAMVESVLMHYPARAASRSRVNPSSPVAQNGQPTAQPAWLDRHSVCRSLDPARAG